VVIKEVVIRQDMVVGDEDNEVIKRNRNIPPENSSFIRSGRGGIFILLRRIPVVHRTECPFNIVDPRMGVRSDIREKLNNRLKT